MMLSAKIGYILLLSNILSCIFMGFIIPSKNSSFKIKYRSSNFSINNKTNENIGIIFKNSIEDAMKNSLNIGGFIVVFSVITGIIKDNAIFQHCP